MDVIQSQGLECLSDSWEFASRISGYDRCLIWNFGSLIPGGDHSTDYTIEWRMPPAVKIAEGCLAWTELALNFVQAARREGTHELFETDDPEDGEHEPEKPTVHDLRRFVEIGLDEEVSDPRYLEPIFRGKSGRCPPFGENLEITEVEEEDPEDEVQSALLSELRKADNKWA